MKVIRNEQRTVSIGLKLMSYGGIEPKNSRTLLFIAATIVRGLFLYLAIDYIENGKTLNDGTDGCEAMFSWIQGGAKLFPIIRHRTKLNALINDLDKFWPSCNTQRANILFKYALIFLNMFYYICIVTWCLYSGAPLFTHKPVFAATVPDFPFARFIVIAAQVLLFLFDVFTVAGLDMVFAALSVNIITQFMVLHDKLEELIYKNPNKLEENVKKCVKQHQFLTKYAATLFEVYKECLIVMYANVIFSLCVQLYTLTEAESAFKVSQRICYVVTLLIQLSFYCIPADKITEIAEDTSYAIYNSKWYKFDKKNSKMINFIIRGSQYELAFSACGLVKINRAALTKIFKSSLSFLALLRQMREKQG